MNTPVKPAITGILTARHIHVQCVYAVQSARICGKDQTMEKIYRVQTNSKGAPNFSTAQEVQTKEVKYFDEDEKVWKVGSVIVDE